MKIELSPMWDPMGHQVCYEGLLVGMSLGNMHYWGQKGALIVYVPDGPCSPGTLSTTVLHGILP